MNFRLKFMEKKLAKVGINIDLSDRLYSTPTTEEEKKKLIKKGKKNKNIKTESEAITKPQKEKK